MQLLEVCAFLAAEPVPVGLYADSPPGLLAEPLATSARSPLSLRRSIRRIAQYGLARVSADGPVIHRLTQAIVRDLLEPAARQAVHGLAEALVAAAGPSHSNNPAQWSQWDALMPHILALTPAVSDNHDLRQTATRASLYMTSETITRPRCRHHKNCSSVGVTVWALTIQTRSQQPLA